MSGDHADTYAFPFNCFPSGLFLWKTTSPYSICSNIWLFFQISDKHRIQPQFLADFLRIWVSQEEERKYICPDLPWRKSASGAFFVPGLFFFKDDEKSSNVSRAHSTHSTCLTNGLWADLMQTKYFNGSVMWDFQVLKSEIIAELQVQTNASVPNSYRHNLE